jgi:hypothetical protein
MGQVVSNISKDCHSIICQMLQSHPRRLESSRFLNIGVGEHTQICIRPYTRQFSFFISSVLLMALTVQSHSDKIPQSKNNTWMSLHLGHTTLVDCTSTCNVSCPSTVSCGSLQTSMEANCSCTVCYAVTLCFLHSCHALNLHSCVRTSITICTLAGPRKDHHFVKDCTTVFCAKCFLK